MRKIDKSVILSTKYREWLEELNKSNKPHPSSSDTYYCDVVMNLLYCQKGVCAYTEKFLCGRDLLTVEHWQDGKYVKNSRESMPEKMGELEHFDPSLKEKKYWEWDNLFVILEAVNLRKSNKEVYEILKPDSRDYDPFKLLAYDYETHRFVVNPDIKDPDQIYRVTAMIKTLGLNFGSVKSEREEFFGEVRFDRGYSLPSRIYQFFTAYEMIKDQMVK
jgi:hypothetical protein